MQRGITVQAIRCDDRSRHRSGKDGKGVSRKSLTSTHHVATTSGYVPRYLHSTGQLPKRGPSTGVFVELVDRMKPDLATPGKPFSFGTLAQAQATGDLESLRAHERHAILVPLGPDPAVTVNRIAVGFQRSTKPRRRVIKKKLRRIAHR